MPKYRIVIRAFTLRRDVGTAYVLGRVLERHGCQVMIACSRNFPDFLVHWRPHAVIINTNSQIEIVKRYAPDSVLISLHGEGAQDKDTSFVKFLSERPDLYAQLDRILLWGRRPRPWFDELLPDHDHQHTAVICGNPRLDLIKFNPELMNTERRRSIGVTGRFHQINYFDGRPTLFALIKQENLLPVIKQAEGFSLIARMLKRLTAVPGTRISIRPHPLEAPEGYAPVLRHVSSDIEIDSSLDFVDWASRQKVIVMPSSTSFLEAYLLDVPLINIAGVIEGSGRSDEPVAAMSEGLAQMPANFEELMDMLDRDFPKQHRVAEIDRHLDEVHDWFHDGSAVLRSAEAILAALDGTRRRPRYHWPKAVMELRDDIRFRRIMRRQPLHANFNYKPGYHKIPPHYETVVDNILAHRPRASLPAS